jgi:exosortase
MTTILKYKRLLPSAMTVIFMLWGFSGMFHRVSQAFSSVREDMSFGWYVPIFSLYVLWTDRAGIRRDAGNPSWRGFLASIPFIAIALLGTRGLQMRMEQLGFIGLCVTIPWTFFGYRAARHFVFPAAFLLFTIPISSFLDFFTIRLRLIASSTALGVLNGFGIAAVQKGTAIISQGAHPFQIDVAEPCSGLRSLFALTALTAAYAWFTQPTWLRRGLLFLCAAPLAVLGNVVRVLSICLVAAYASPDYALGFYHDYSGYVVFIVAICAMVAVGEGITRISRRFKGSKDSDGAKSVDGAENIDGDRDAKDSNGGSWLAWTAFAVFAAAFVFQSLTPAVKIMSAPDVSLPADIDGFTSDEVRYCQNEQCCGFYRLSRLDQPAANCPACGNALDAISLGEHRILPPDTQFRGRLYTSSSGASFLVSVVIGGETKSSIHRPELCLPAQGYLLGRPADFNVGGRPFHSVEMTPPGGLPGTLVYTFFNQAGMRTASHVSRILADVWDRSVLNRVDRWVMVTVHASADGGFTRSSPADRRQLEVLLSRLSEMLP